MSKSLLRAAILGAPLLLAACGEGYEAQKTDNYFPYGNKRTAGSGVAYVVAQMMPEKELNVTPEVVAPAPVAAPVAPVLDAEEIFNDDQGKKSHAYNRTHQSHVNSHASSAPSSIAPSSHNAIQQEVAASDVAEPVRADVSGLDDAMPSVDTPEVAIMHAPQPVEIVEEVIANELPQPIVEHMSAEEYVSRAPTHVSTPEVKVIDVAPPPPLAIPLEKEIEIPQELIEDDEHGARTGNVQNLEPAAGSDDVFGDIREEVIELYREDVGGSQSNIVAPKRDLYLPFLRDQSRDELDDIYQQF